MPTPPAAAPRDAGSSPEEQGGLEWSYNPWHESAPRALASVGAALGLIALAVWTALPLPVLLVLGIGTAILLAPGFVPTRCRVDDLGVARRLAWSAWDARAWAAIRSTSLTRRDVRIATRPAVGALAPFHTLVLPLPGSSEATGLRARVRARLEAHGD